MNLHYCQGCKLFLGVRLGDNLKGSLDQSSQIFQLRHLGFVDIAGIP